MGFPHKASNMLNTYSFGGNATWVYTQRVTPGAILTSSCSNGPTDRSWPMSASASEESEDSRVVVSRWRFLENQIGAWDLEIRGSDGCSKSSSRLDNCKHIVERWDCDWKLKWSKAHFFPLKLVLHPVDMDVLFIQVPPWKKGSRQMGGK